MQAPAFSSPAPLLFSRPTLLRTSFSPCPNVTLPRRPSRALLRMQTDDASEETPSDTYVAAAEAVATLTPEDETSKRASLIQRLLYLAATTSRGQFATEAQAAAVDDIVMSLEELNPTPQPVETDLLDGMWTLVYSSAKLFDGNPLLMVATKPLLQLGQIRQRIAVDDGRLVTEGDLLLFPATSATVKTTSRVTPVGGERLEITVETTTVTGGKLADRFDLGGISFDVPVEQILSRLRNVSPETYLDTYYLDDKLRISRSKKGKLYIYTRLD